MDKDNVTLHRLRPERIHYRTRLSGRLFSGSSHVFICSGTVGLFNYRSMEIVRGALSTLMLSDQSVSGSLLKISKVLDGNTPHEP